MPAEDKVILLGNRFMIAINLRLQSEKVIEFKADVQKVQKIYTFSASKMFCLQQVQEQW